MTGTPDRYAHLLPRPFRIAHKAWAAVVLLGCVALALGGGHPPPIVFAPLLILAGLVGHLLLVLVAWLLHRGRSPSPALPGAAPRWPAELVLIGIVLGPLAVASTALALSQVAQHGSQPRQWLVYVVAATVHAMAFVALLLRWPLARYLVAVICVGWGLALALQFREPRPTVDLLIAIVVIAVLVAIAAYVVLAKRIRSALR